MQSEQDLIAALGAPLIAARPLRPALAGAIGELLVAHWFCARRVLPVVSACPGEGRSAATAMLAQACAALGLPTLLIDADLRAPSQHRLFGLGARAGLAELLEGRPAAPAACGENLAVLAAGRVRRDPLELLALRPLPGFLARAARCFRVVLVDTPAAARGPDLQIFAAFAGGALVVARRGRASRARLAALRGALERCAARVVGSLVRET